MHNEYPIWWNENLMETIVVILRLSYNTNRIAGWFNSYPKRHIKWKCLKLEQLNWANFSSSRIKWIKSILSAAAATCTGIADNFHRHRENALI